MASSANVLIQDTAYNPRSEQITSATSPAEPQTPRPETDRRSITFAKAAFAFRDGLNHSQTNRASREANVAVKTVPETPPPEDEPDTTILADKAHQERHKRRIRNARAVQRILTSILSLAVAILQGLTYASYSKHKDQPGVWPEHPDLLPTLTLLATAVAALFIDVCTLVAYLWPQKKSGQRAFSLATTAHYVVTTIKGISYSYSTIICKGANVQGNKSGANNDLWSWSCKMKTDSTVTNVVNASANCSGSNIAWILAIANVAIEVLGLAIDQVMKQDAARWPSTTAPAPIAGMKSAGSGSDSKPLLSKTMMSSGKGGYQRLDDEKAAQLDAFGDELDQGLRSSLPNLKLQQ